MLNVDEDQLRCTAIIFFDNLNSQKRKILSPILKSQIIFPKTTYFRQHRMQGVKRCGPLLQMSLSSVVCVSLCL